MTVSQAIALFLCACLVGIDAYDASLPPFDSIPSASTLKEQRAAGQQLLEDLERALSNNESSFFISEAVYRINRSISIADTFDFELKVDNAEIIIENGGNTFELFGNTNITLQGPMYLDAKPFGFTQGRITATDNETYIELRMMTEYPAAQEGKVNRLQFFAPNGTMLPNTQVEVDSVKNVSRGVIRLQMPDSYWVEQNNTRLEQIQTGNLVSLETTEYPNTGGIYLRGNDGVRLSQIVLYSKALLFAQYETGLIYVDQWYGVRRPGTSRLTAGGQLLVSLQGGSWHMLNSEIGYSFDDLTDVQSGIYYAYNQTSPTQIYMPIIDGRELSVGDTLTFYNVETYANDGTAKVANISTALNTQVTKNFGLALGELGLRNDTNNLTRITLDRDIRMTSLIDIVDITEYRTSYMIFENCYMHDGLSSGILGKGSQQYIVRNCSIARAFRGIETSVDPYWGEGGIAGNILIQGNTVENCPYGQLGLEPTIATASSSSTLAQTNFTIFNNVTINNNTILNSAGTAIALRFASNVNITGNTIINPMAAVADNSDDTSTPIDSGSAIFLDVVRGSVQVSGNVIVGANAQNVPQIIRASNDTDSGIVNLCSNAASSSPSLNLIKRLPNELWKSVLPNSSMVTSTADFRVESFLPAAGRVPAVVDVNISDQHAASTFSFQGTGVQFLTCTGPQFGMVRIYLDGIIIQDVDASISLQGIRPDSDTGFCNQLVFAATSLPNTLHNLTVENLLQEGLESEDGATNVTIGGFAYLTGKNQCGLSSDPESSFGVAESFLRSAYNNWVNYRTTGILGPNVSSVVFSNSSINTDGDLELGSVNPLAVAPVPVPFLATAPGVQAPILPPSLQAGPPVPSWLAPAISTAAG